MKSLVVIEINGSLSREAPIYSQSLKVICLQPTDSHIFKSRKQVYKEREERWIFITAFC